MATFYYISNGLSIYSLELCGWGDRYPPPVLILDPSVFWLQSSFLVLAAWIVFLSCDNFYFLSSFSDQSTLVSIEIATFGVDNTHKKSLFINKQHLKQISFWLGHYEVTMNLEVAIKNVKLQLGNILNTNVTFHVQSEMVRSWEGSLAQAAMKRPVSRVLPIMSC